MGGSSFFAPRRWKMGGFFVLRTRKIEEPSPHLRRTRTPPRLPSDLRPILRGRRSKIEDRGLFDLRLRRSKMGEKSSIFGSEDRRWGRFFEDGGFLRRWKRSSKMEGFFEEPPHLRKPPSHLRRTPSIFVLRVRRSKTPHLRSSEPKPGSKIVIGPVVAAPPRPALACLV